MKFFVYEHTFLKQGMKKNLKEGSLSIKRIVQHERWRALTTFKVAIWQHVCSLLGNLKFLSGIDIITQTKQNLTSIHTEEDTFSKFLVG